MPDDVTITVEKIDNCHNDFCWCLFRSDRKEPVVGGLTKQQAINHKKIMLNLLQSMKMPLVPSSIG